MPRAFGRLKRVKGYGTSTGPVRIRCNSSLLRRRGSFVCRSTSRYTSRACRTASGQWARSFTCLIIMIVLLLLLNLYLNITLSSCHFGARNGLCKDSKIKMLAKEFCFKLTTENPGAFLLGFSAMILYFIFSAVDSLRG